MLSIWGSLTSVQLGHFLADISLYADDSEWDYIYSTLSRDVKTWNQNFWKNAKSAYYKIIALYDSYDS